MRRREFLETAGLAVLVSGGVRAAAAGEKIERLKKPKEAWRELLHEARYQVLFEEATEPPYTSPLLEEKREGLYICAACFLPLFESRTKYDSRTGWPSFYDSIRGRTGTKFDMGFGRVRTEYHCARCGGHQGHIFDDGPAPTGERWCNNGLALAFVAATEELPSLRG